MAKLKQLISGSLLLFMLIVPLFVGTSSADDGTSSAGASTKAAHQAARADLTPAAQPVNVTALLGVLVMKGVLSPSEANAIRDAAPNEEFQRLVEALTRKGLVNAADLPADTSTSTVPPMQTTRAPGVSPAGGEGHVKDVKPAGPRVVSAVTPLRVLPVDPPPRGGLKAAFTLGPVKMTPYGFLRATAVYDDSNPNGDDMPFPGLFLNNAEFSTSTGPTKDPEFHLKARQARMGANFEFPDLSPRLTLTGRIEGDFEGNFTEVDNRDVSSIRSSMFSFRQGWARLDYAASQRTDLYFEGGQDWTLFGSSALPNLLETTALGYWYGDVYERSPQFQFGMVQKLGGARNFKLSPTFAIMMPTSSEIEKLGSLGVTGQLAQAEREGADSGRPEFEGRLALQFQLDKAPGVAPAQIIFSGVEGRRSSVVPNSSLAYAGLPANYAAAFPDGFTASSSIYGVQGALQLPTRWFTLVMSAYRGGDLRFFFGGQVNSYATSTAGLTNIEGSPGLPTLDGGPLAAAGGAVLGCNINVASPQLCPEGNVVVAPQKPIRAFGGFVNLGLPLSRWFKANPEGHNAGWQFYLHMGKDQVYKGDLNNPGFTADANTLSPLPLLMGKLTAATLYYKLNPYVTFAGEQSIYATRLAPGLTYTIAGKPSNEWQDHRSEFGPIFTF
ncbi:MAG TPA: hypothetical protein VMG31_15085 [Verrucomicrobiae bacterium]|nr:hypothetical protein [Verrucomicrobiae bacterium]